MIASQLLDLVQRAAPLCRAWLADTMSCTRKQLLQNQGVQCHVARHFVGEPDSVFRPESSVVHVLVIKNGEDTPNYCK
jgi:hypothetical protein